MTFEFRTDREAHLRMLCEEMGRSVDDFVSEAVLTFMEDYEDARDADESLQEGGSTVSAEEMRKQLGLDGQVQPGIAEAA